MVLLPSRGDRWASLLLLMCLCRSRAFFFASCLRRIKLLGSGWILVGHVGRNESALIVSWHIPEKTVGLGRMSVLRFRIPSWAFVMPPCWKQALTFSPAISERLEVSCFSCDLREFTIGRHASKAWLLAERVTKNSFT